VPAESAVFAIRAALFNLDRLVRDGLTQEEFETARGFLRGYTLLWEQTPSRRLGYALDDLFYGTENHLAAFRTALDSMTLEQVNAALRRWIEPERLRIVAVARDAQGLRQALLADAPVSLSYTAEKVAPAVAADDEKISAFKLRLAPEQVEIVPVGKLFE
jgi:zinc protease